MKLDYVSCPPIPPRVGIDKQFGLAGPVAGADGNFVMVAGGANFENGLPWKGGLKRYHDDIYLLEEKKDGSFSWRVSKTKLPFPLAYPACITLKDGFISIGGENEEGPTKAVFKFSFADGEIKAERLPDLPEGLSSAGASFAGNQIFVAGGVNQAGESCSFYTLSLTFSGDGWKKLPDLPVKLSHAVVVTQNEDSAEAIYVLGGRNKSGEVSTFLNSVFKYSLKEQKWSFVNTIKEGGEPVKLSAGTGFAYKEQIILFGGDRGILFNQTERMNLELAAESEAVKKDSLLKRKDNFLTNHPGFSNHILAYNTISKTWSSLGEIPGKAPVTTVVFPWKGKFVVPSGEVRPGVRSDSVIIFSVRPCKRGITE